MRDVSLCLKRSLQEIRAIATTSNTTSRIMFVFLVQPMLILPATCRPVLDVANICCKGCRVGGPAAG